MSGADQWLLNFQEVTRARSLQLAKCEVEKGDLEAAMMLLGSQVLRLFPADVQEGMEITNVIMTLLEELKARREKEKADV